MPLGAARDQDGNGQVQRAEKAGTTEGATALYQKLHSAAVRVCVDAEHRPCRSPSRAASRTRSTRRCCRWPSATVSALHLQSLIGASKLTTGKKVPAKRETVASR